MDDLKRGNSRYAPGDPYLHLRLFSPTRSYTFAITRSHGPFRLPKLSRTVGRGRNLHWGYICLTMRQERYR